jgi:hypothetical protein
MQKCTMTESTKGVISWLLRRLENLEHELVAHRIVPETVKSGLPAAGVVDVLQTDRESVDVQAKLDAKYKSISGPIFPASRRSRHGSGVRVPTANVESGRAPQLAAACRG